MFPGTIVKLYRIFFLTLREIRHSHRLAMRMRHALADAGSGKPGTKKPWREATV
jgi:hypothetical protein